MQCADEAPGGPLLEVHVIGVLDGRTAPYLREQLERAVALGSGLVVVNMARCHFVDAVGIDLLARMHQRVRATGGRLTLRAIPNRLFRALAGATVCWVLQTEAGTGTRSSGPGPS
jgi:anti-sigma B factor antagonist